MVLCHVRSSGPCQPQLAFTLLSLYGCKMLDIYRVVSLATGDQEDLTCAVGATALHSMSKFKEGDHNDSHDHMPLQW